MQRGSSKAQFLLLLRSAFSVFKQGALCKQAKKTARLWGETDGQRKRDAAQLQMSIDCCGAAEKNRSVHLFGYIDKKEQ